MGNISYDSSLSNYLKPGYLKRQNLFGKDVITPAISILRIRQKSNDALQAYNNYDSSSQKEDEIIPNLKPSYGYGTRMWFDHDGTYLADFEDKSLPLYKMTERVPQLPVNSLESTIQLLLSSARAVATSNDEFEELERYVKEELNNNNSTLWKLHMRVLQRAEVAKAERTSWFIDMWNRWAYLEYREPVAHNVSYFLQLRDESPKRMEDYLGRAARFIYSALQYRQLVVSGTLEPDCDPKTGVPFENSQHRFLFHCCRIPSPGQDKVRSYDPNVNKSVCIVRKNQFYIFGFENAGGVVLPVEIIKLQLERIIEDADSLSKDAGSAFLFGREMEAPGFGILTSDHRDRWCKNRRLLLRNNNNGAAEVFRQIESSAFLICLDDEKPNTRKELAYHFLNGGKHSGSNRFWDKTSQIIVCENGKIAYLAEHSMIDGMTTARFMAYCGEKMMSVASTTHIDPPSESESLPLTPERLVFRASPYYRMIRNARLRFKKLVGNKDCDVFIQENFGSEQIKKLGLSPDAFAQMAIQLASRKVFGYYQATYESIQTRTFQHGRTEVTRSCSTDSVKFCDAILARKQSKDEIRSLLIEACQAHTQYTSKAAKGLGCDRHLLGMKLSVLNDETLPEFFNLPLFKFSQRWGISTSCINSEMFDGWGFGEVVKGGIGVAYAVLKTHLRFTVSSEKYSSQFKPSSLGKRQQKKFTSLAEEVCHALNHSIKEMRQLFEE